MYVLSNSDVVRIYPGTQTQITHVCKFWVVLPVFGTGEVKVFRYSTLSDHSEC